MPVLQFRALMVGITLIAAVGMAVYQHFSQQEPQKHGQSRQRRSPSPPKKTHNGSKNKSSEQTSSTEQDKTPSAATKCSICFDPIGCKSGESLVCKHIFHSQCLAPWLTCNDTCPNCRTSTKCSMCKRDNYGPHQQKAIILSCNHAFHRACVMKWLMDHETCPSCENPVNVM